MHVHICDAHARALCITPETARATRLLTRIYEEGIYTRHVLATATLSPLMGKNIISSRRINLASSHVVSLYVYGARTSSCVGIYMCT